MCNKMSQYLFTEESVIMSGNRYQRIIPKIKTLDSGNMHSLLQHLSREQGFLDTIFNTIHEAVIVTDSTRRFLYHNTAAKSMLGLPDDLSQLTLDKALKGANWDAILPHECEDIPENGSRILRQTLEIFYPQRRIVQIYAQPLAGTDNRAAVILNDITATMDQAYSDAENERSRLVSMLAAGVAHEIGNPLNSLYLHLQYLQRLIARDELDKDGAAEELSEARKEVERLDTIINQFLRALRPGKPDFQLIDLKTLVLESLSFMRHEITAREVKVEFVWDDNVPFVNGDPGQLKQAFYNLVRNALQSMAQGGMLGIHCSAGSDFVSLSVSDSGKGIGQKELSHIFEAYFTTKNTGSGLGLMIVERIIREHGGSLAVSSGEGEGATFTISLPRPGRLVRTLPAPDMEDQNEKQK